MKLIDMVYGYDDFSSILEDISEVDGTYDMDPKTKAFVQMGQKITASLSIGSGVEWPDDAQFNKAAALGQQLSSIGSSFGARSAGEALKDANVTPDEAKAIIAKVKDANVSIAKSVKDPEKQAVDADEGLGGAVAGAAAGDSLVGKIGGAYVGYKTQKALNRNEKNIKRIARALASKGIDVGIAD